MTVLGYEFLRQKAMFCHFVASIDDVLVGQGQGVFMNSWWVLGIAIVAEVIATSALKASDGFSRFWPSLLVVMGYGVAFYCLSITLKSIPVGVAYAIWSGMGVVLISTVAWLWFGQKLDAATIVGMALIVAGVLVINLFSKATLH